MVWSDDAAIRVLGTSAHCGQHALLSSKRPYGEDPDSAWLLRWRPLPSKEQPVDPYGTGTRKAAAERIIRPEMNAEALRAYELDPRQPLVNSALAGIDEDSVHAEFLSRYSRARLPSWSPKNRSAR